LAKPLTVRKSRVGFRPSCQDPCWPASVRSVLHRQSPELHRTKIEAETAVAWRGDNGAAVVSQRITVTSPKPVRRISLAPSGTATVACFPRGHRTQSSRTGSEDGNNATTLSCAQYPEPHRTSRVSPRCLLARIGASWAPRTSKLPAGPSKRTRRAGCAPRLRKSLVNQLFWVTARSKRPSASKSATAHARCSPNTRIPDSAAGMARKPFAHLPEHTKPSPAS